MTEKKIVLNVWQIATFVLLVALIVLIYFEYTGMFLLARSSDAKKIGEKVINYINTYLVQPGTKASLKDVKYDNSLGLYVILTEYGGNEIPVYVSSNGKYLILLDERYIFDLDKPLNIAENVQQGTTQVNIPKTDRPKVELFIWSYCPYGVQALKPFANVAKLMKDYADFYVKFNGDYHGDFERQQNFIQICIIRLYSNKYWDYAIKFVDEVYRKCYGNVTCDKEESIRLMKELNIDYNKVLDCVSKNGEEYYKKDLEDASVYGASGSPSFVINGVYVRNVIRTEEGIKNVVCQAFNNPPDICSQTLSTQVQNVPQGSC